MADQQPQAQYDPTAIIGGLNVDKTTKANLWEDAHGAQNEQELQVKLQGYKIPNDAKAQLWEWKHSQAASQPKAASKPEIPDELTNLMGHGMPTQEDISNLGSKHPSMEHGVSQFWNALGIPTSKQQLYQMGAEEKNKTFGDRLKDAPLGALGSINSLIAGGKTLKKAGNEQVESDRALSRGDIQGAAAHQIGAVGYGAAGLSTPIGGQNLVTAGEQFGSGDVSGGIGTTAATLSPFGLNELLPKGGSATKPIQTDNITPAHHEAMASLLDTKAGKVDPYETSQTTLPLMRNQAAKAGIKESAFKGREGGKVGYQMADKAIESHQNEISNISEPHMDKKVDMSPIAKAYRSEITDEMRNDAPDVVKRIEDEASNFDRTGTVQEVNDFRKRSNQDQQSYWRKGESQKIMSDTEVQASVKAANAARKLQQDTIGNASGVDPEYLHKLFSEEGDLIDTRNALNKKYNDVSKQQAEASSKTAREMLIGTKGSIPTEGILSRGADFFLQKAFGLKPMDIMNLRLKKAFSSLGEYQPSIQPPAPGGVPPTGPNRLMLPQGDNPPIQLGPSSLQGPKGLLQAAPDSIPLHQPINDLPAQIRDAARTSGSNVDTGQFKRGYTTSPRTPFDEQLMSGQGVMQRPVTKPAPDTISQKGFQGILDDIARGASQRKSPQEPVPVKESAFNHIKKAQEAQQQEDKMIAALHYSNNPALKELDPNMFGLHDYTSEAKRVSRFPDTGQRVAFLGEQGKFNESRIQSLPNRYKAAIKAGDVYDLKTDPDGLASKAFSEAAKKGSFGNDAVTSMVEKMAKDAGYKGTIDTQGVLRMWDKVPVKYDPRMADVFTSPNTSEGTMSIADAEKAIRTPEHRAFRQAAEDTAKEYGLGAKAIPSVGNWTDGAENSVHMQIPRDPGMTDTEFKSKVRAVAAEMGIKGNQKAVAVFREMEGGPDHFHVIELPYGKMSYEQIAKTLDDHGIHDRTIHTETGKDVVSLIDKGKKLDSKVDDAVKALDVREYKTYEGEGEFNGAQTREEARKVFEEQIRSEKERSSQKVQQGAGSSSVSGSKQTGASKVNQLEPVPEGLPFTADMWNRLTPEAKSQWRKFLQNKTHQTVIDNARRQQFAGEGLGFTGSAPSSPSED